MTPELLEPAGGSAGLKTWLTQNKVTPASWVLQGRTLDEEDATILAILTRADKSQATLEIVLVPVKGK